jgi:nucleotide-binding universal stress UspA family protein
MVGYNGTEEALDALALGQNLADAIGAELILGGVVQLERSSVGFSDLAREQAEDLRTLLEDAVEDGAQLAASLKVVAARSPAPGLYKLANREAVDLMVLGSSRRGALGRVFAGSMSERLLHGAQCSVAVAPRGFRNEARREPRVVGVGFDGRPESHRALQHALAIAKESEAALRVFAVQDPKTRFRHPSSPEYGVPGAALQTEREYLENGLNETLDQLPPSVRAQGSVLDGSPAEMLNAAAEGGMDLLVVGSRGYGPLKRVLLGGVSSALVRSAPCPVLVVPRGEREMERDVSQEVLGDELAWTTTE